MSAEGNVSSARAGQKTGKAVVLAIGAFVIAAIAFSGGWLLGGRRTVLGSTSPSRDAVAYIFEARCAGGSCQSLMIGANSRDVRPVETLKGDSEKADEIAWTPDGGRVGFLVNGYQLRIFDARTGANLGAVNLIEPDRSPSTRVARGVTFSTNGAAVTFDDCPRAHSGCRPGLVALR